MQSILAYAKFGNVKKKKPILNNETRKKFDSAEYFQNKKDNENMELDSIM